MLPSHDLVDVPGNRKKVTGTAPQYPLQSFVSPFDSRGAGFVEMRILVNPVADEFFSVWLVPVFHHIFNGQMVLPTPTPFCLGTY